MADVVYVLLCIAVILGAAWFYHNWRKRSRHNFVVQADQLKSIVWPSICPRCGRALGADDSVIHKINTAEGSETEIIIEVELCHACKRKVDFWKPGENLGCILMGFAFIGPFVVMYVDSTPSAAHMFGAGGVFWLGYFTYLLSVHFKQVGVKIKPLRDGSLQMQFRRPHVAQEFAEQNPTLGLEVNAGNRGPGDLKE